MVVVVGKTSEQEGDDKLFVEKAYALSMENMHSLSTQLNTKATASIRQYVNKSLEKTFDISLKATTLKAKADEIKNVLKQFPGEETVYLLVNNKKIKTSYKVKSCPELENQIQNLIAS